MSKTNGRRTHFVPKVVFRTAFAGVVPACVAAVACGGQNQIFAVACMALDGGPCGAPPAPDASSESIEAGFFSVAARAFDAAPADASPTDASPDHTVLAVACTSFACMGVGVAAFADGGDAADAAPPRDGGGSG
jgi:hypothetical protein